MLRAFDRCLSRFSTALRSGDNQGVGNIYPLPIAARLAGYLSGARVVLTTYVLFKSSLCRHMKAKPCGCLQYARCGTYKAPVIDNW